MVVACEDFRRKRQEFGGMRGQCFLDSVGKEHVLCFPSLVQTSAFVSHSMGFMAVALEVSKCLVLVSGPTEPVVQGPL